MSDAKVDAIAEVFTVSPSGLATTPSNLLKLFTTPDFGNKALSLPSSVY